MTSWFFIEMAAKSALICGIALLLAMAIRDRAASDRARVLRIGVALLLALPLVDAVFPALQIEAFAAPAAAAPMTLSATELQALMALGAGAAPVEASIWDDPAPLILLLWAAGALVVASRLAIGLYTLARWTRAAGPATDPMWVAALDRAREASGAPANLRLLVGDKVPGPLGWGFRNPVILIDVDTYAEREEADAILAHEVAHVARGDWPALMATRLATALFWFNPLVWALAREAVQQAEEAADAHAAHVVEPTRYAETLLSWAQIGRGIAVPANSIAPARGLTRRVRAVLEPRLRERSAGSRVAVMAMLVCVGIAAPVTALEFVEAARPEAPPRAPAAPLAPQARPAAPRMSAVRAPDAPPAPVAPAAPATRRAPAAPAAPDAPDAPELPEVAVAGPAIDALRVVLPQMPVIVASAVDRIDAAKLSHAVNASRRVHLSQADLQHALDRARASRPDVRLIEAQVRRELPDHAAMRGHVHSGILGSAQGMLRSAEGMERGAATMDQQARRFRNREERERIIAHERARGQEVTHEQLLEAAEGMEDGARGMREGAREMRRGARQMMNHH